MKIDKIVIVENDEDEQFFMRAGFESAGLFEIIAQLRNGDALFEWMAEHPDVAPDLILSDLNMPGRNGYDILNGFRSHPTWCRIPVIITSTSSTPSIIESCMKCGAAGYMVKPDTFIEYEPYVHRLFDLVRGLRAPAAAE